jgi:hypothetical protein
MHSSSHSLGDLRNDVLVFGLEEGKDINDFVELLQESLLIFLANVSDRPAMFVEFLVELKQKRKFQVLWNTHVILDSIQSSEHKIKDTDCIFEVFGQDLDDIGKRTRDFVESFVAEVQRREMSEMLEVLLMHRTYSAFTELDFVESREFVKSCNGWEKFSQDTHAATEVSHAPPSTPAEYRPLGNTTLPR